MPWPPTSADFTELRRTLEWVYANSPYYTRLFDRAGVKPAALRDYDDFRARVPRTAKADLVENQRQHPPFGEFLAVPRERAGGRGPEHDRADRHSSQDPVHGLRSTLLVDPRNHQKDSKRKR